MTSKLLHKKLLLHWFKTSSLVSYVTAEVFTLIIEGKVKLDK